MQQNLATIFYKRASQLQDKPAVRFKEGRGPYRELSWKDFSNMVRNMGAGLAHLGLKTGGRAAILSQTSHLWVASDLAILSASGVSVPIYPTSSQNDLEFILANSGSNFLFVQNEALLNKVLAVADKVPELKKVILLSPPKGGRSLSELDVDHNLVIGLEELEDCGREALNEKPGLIDERVGSTKLDDTATIIYTSGTTGTPKGVKLTYRNVLSVMKDLHSVLPITEDDVYLSFLPLSHVFERICGEYYWLHSGGECAFAEGIESVGKNMAEIRPSMILVVPRVLDRIYSKVRNGIQGASPRAQKLIYWAIEVGKEMVRHSMEGREPRLGLKAKHWVAERLVFQKLRNRIGDRLRLVVSGGAAATAEVIEFFNAIGITTLEGYGLTETTAPAAVNRSGKVKPGTVGPSLPSVDIKIADDGEILIRGDSVFKGYFGTNGNTPETTEVFTDDWFHTGDIGLLDSDGYLKITDRKKDLLVNSAGKNIAPQRIEAVLKQVSIINQAIVFGDKQKHLVALLTLDETATSALAEENNWYGKTWSDLVETRELNQYLKQEINKVSSELAEYERVRKFKVLAEDLSVEKGELTATLKVKRNVVTSNYKAVIDSLYNEESKLVSSKR